MLRYYVKDLVSGFFEKTHRGAMTMVSLLFVFWAAIKLLGTVEKAFNNIWEVKRHRPMMQKIFYYWTILTLGPLLIGAGLYLKTMKIISENLYGVMSALDHFNGWGWVFTLISFYLLFWSMPNTKVRPSAAFWGALVTTIIWTEVKRLYGYYVFEFEPFKQLYGVLALIPITILWINISWQIVLFGVHLSYIVQNFKALDVAAKVSEEKNRFYYPSPDSAFQITAFIGQIFDGGGEPVSEEQVCEKFEAPHSFVSSLLEELTKAGLLYEIVNGRTGYIPSRSTDKIHLSEVAKVISYLPRQYASDDYIKASENYGKLLDNITLADLIERNSEECLNKSSAADC